MISSITMDVQFEVRTRYCNNNNVFKSKPFFNKKLLRNHAYFLGIIDVEYNAMMNLRV